MAPTTARTPDAAARPEGLTPLPRRVPQTSLATELREDSTSAAAVEEDGYPDDFTAERAASSLAGFQRGTLRAHADADLWSDDPQETSTEEAPGPPVTAASTSQTPTPPADRS